MKIKIKKIFECRFDIPQLNKAEKIIKSMPLTEKIIFYFLVGLLVFSTFLMLYKLNNLFLIEVPAKGGEITEGVIGTPRFINPLLDISDVDRDLTILVYSGLLRVTPDGDFIPDLAKEYSISDDGLIYTLKLKDKIFFHDGVEVTTDDIAFTIKLTQDNIIKSPKKINWDGVSVKQINKKEIQFILKKAYSPFLENLTLGILPKHIWEKIQPEQFAFSQFNIEPIGSGPYKISKIEKNSSGILEKYILKSFKNYALGEPYISKLTMVFYPNEEEIIDAYKNKKIESLSAISSAKVEDLKKENSSIRIEKTSMPRIFGVFFNQNKNEIFAHKEIREALNLAVDKEEIVDKVLNGYGVVINNPIPPSSKYFDKSISVGKNNLTEAINLLEKNGWKLNEETGIREKKIKKIIVPLEFSISTSNATDLKLSAEIIKENWEKLGAKVTIKIFDIGDLNQNVIRPREYEALLFGEVIGRGMDLFAFWHSSQRNDPGLNIASYTNITVDKLLEDVRSIYDEEERKEKYIEFQKEVLNDIPVVFIYSPNFLYIIPEKVNNFSLGQITTSSERFLNIQNWNVKTNKIWTFFAKNKK